MLLRKKNFLLEKKYLINFFLNCPRLLNFLLTLLQSALDTVTSLMSPTIEKMAEDEIIACIFSVI